MKQIIIICMMLCTFTSFAQEETKQESFTEVLKPYVEEWLDLAKQGVDFAVRETPIVIKQYVMYEAVISWSLVAVAFILLLPLHKIRKVAQKSDPDWDTPVVFFAWCGYIIPIIVFFHNIGTAIMTTWFPKLFLVRTFIESM